MDSFVPPELRDRLQKLDKKIRIGNAHVGVLSNSVIQFSGRCGRINWAFCGHSVGVPWALEPEEFIRIVSDMWALWSKNVSNVWAIALYFAHFMVVRMLGTAQYSTRPVNFIFRDQKTCQSRV